jgi:hypothetical protein
LVFDEGTESADIATNNISKYYNCTMKTQGSHPVSNFDGKQHSKALRRSEKMHPARFSRPKSTFLSIPILIAGTNSVSSGNIVEESFFDKIVADKLKVPTII